MLYSGDLLNRGKLIDGLGVVGHRAIRIHCDRYRPHPQKAEGNQAEGEHRRRHHHPAHAERADAVSNRH